MKRLIGYFIISVILMSGSSLDSVKAGESVNPVTITVDMGAPVTRVPMDFLSTGKYTLDPDLQERAKKGGFPLIRVDCLLDAVEPVNDDPDPLHFNMSGFQWGQDAGQYGSDLDEIIQHMIGNGHKPMIILHRTQPWNGNAEGDWRSVPKDIGEWAEAAAATVYHYNVELKLGITYWEIWNEPNGGYEWLGTMDQYMAMALAAAQRMKGVDPSIKVGGPALAWNDLDTMRRVVAKMNAIFDFYSWHAYGTGGDDSTKITDAQLLAETGRKYGDFARQLKKPVSRYETPERHIGLVMDEFNIDWAETPLGAKRREGPINAVWTASVLGHLLYAGVDITGIFSLTECGILKDGTEPTPVYRLYPFLSANLKGQVYPVTSGSKDVEAIVNSDDGKPCVWLINKSPSPVQVMISIPGFEDGRIARVWQLADGKDAKRISARSFGLGTKPLVIPGYSVTALIY